MKTVFIGGYPRSGTTIAQAVLDSSPEISLTNEQSFIHAFQFLYRKFSPRVHAEPLAFAPEDLEILLPLLTKHWIKAWEEYHEGRKEAKMIGDKVPASICYFDWLRARFDKPKFIICTRNMVDTVNSMKKNVPQFAHLGVKDLINAYKQFKVHIDREAKKEDTFVIDLDKTKEGDFAQYANAVEFLGLDGSLVDLTLLNNE